MTNHSHNKRNHSKCTLAFVTVLDWWYQAIHEYNDLLWITEQNLSHHAWMQISLAIYQYNS